MGTLVILVSRWSVFIGTSLLGAALAAAPADSAGVVALRDDVSNLLADFLVAASLAAWLLNLWLSAHGGFDLSAYRFYPVPLGGVALLVRMRRTIQVRYLTTSFAVAAIVHLLTGEVGFAAWCAAGLLPVLFDCTALFTQTLHGTWPWASYAVIVLLLAIAFADVYGGHLASGYAFALSMHRSRTTAFLLIPLFGLTCGSVMRAHRQIKTRLRYMT